MSGPDTDEEPYETDEDGRRTPWCRDFANHTAVHEFCGHHQASWCRTCDDGQCPDCVDDPHCSYCGAALLEEYHDWDCAYNGDDDA